MKGTLKDLSRLVVAAGEMDPDEWPDPDPGDEPKKVALVGFGMDRVLAPYGAEGWELWGLNDQPRRAGFAPLRCYTRWFQLHPPHYLEVHYPQGVEDLNRTWMHRHGIRLYMDRHYPKYPESEPYPKEEVEETFPLGTYHTSSFDWMLALAMLEGFEEIHMYGIDFFTFPTILNGEPISARACLEYWVGLARGMGIEVHIFGRGDMFKNIHLAVYRSDLQYGFEREPALDLSKDDENWRDQR